MEDTPVFKIGTSARKKQPVVLEDESGNLIECELREMTAASRDSYLNESNKRLILDEVGKVTGIKKFDNMHAELLTRCLYKKVGEKWELVTAAEVNQWPCSASALLFQAAQQINRVGKDQEQEAKND